VIGCPFFYLCYLHINKLHTVWISLCWCCGLNWYRETSASLCHPCVDALSQHLQSVHVNHCCGDCDNHTQHCTCQTTATTQLDLKAKYITCHPYTHTTFLYNISSIKCSETNLMHHLSSVYSVTIPLHVSGWMTHRQLIKTYSVYRLSHIYIFTSWWCATSKPKACRGIVLNKLRISGASSWFHYTHISRCTVNKT
jgi:hypothetical protein